MSVLTTKPKFLYPTSRQFPFDEVSEKIVRALEKRNWEVPGITVEFVTYGSGEAKYKQVKNIIGADFELCFCRYQGKLDSIWKDLAGIYSICIPEHMTEVSTYEDESYSKIPNVYLFEGGNNGELMSLKYRGRYYTQRPKEFLSDDDSGRETKSEKNDSSNVNPEQKFNEFAEWLEKNVLEYILSFEEKQPSSLVGDTVELIPYSGPWSTVYSLCNRRDAERITRGKENARMLPPEERHGKIGKRTRLVPLDVKNEKRFPEVAYHGFTWCDVSQNENVIEDGNFISSVLMEMGLFLGGAHVVAINLKYANDVYVVDNARFRQTQEQLFEKISPRKRLSNKELGKVFAARAATIIPITEYKGDYEEPVVLVGRELELEEIGQISEIII